MRGFRTAFTPLKAKRMLRDKFDMQPIQRGDCIMVDDDDYDIAIEHIRKKEETFLEPWILQQIDKKEYDLSACMKTRYGQLSQNLKY